MIVKNATKGKMRRHIYKVGGKVIGKGIEYQRSDTVVSIETPDDKKVTDEIVTKSVFDKAKL